jgi:hypothetical protein
MQVGQIRAGLLNMEGWMQVGQIRAGLLNMELSQRSPYALDMSGTFHVYSLPLEEMPPLASFSPLPLSRATQCNRRMTTTTETLSSRSICASPLPSPSPVQLSRSCS